MHMSRTVSPAKAASIWSVYTHLLYGHVRDRSWTMCGMMPAVKKMSRAERHLDVHRGNRGN